MALIHIDDLKFYGYHGVFPEENKVGQYFIFSVDMELSDKVRMQADDLTGTVHYGLVSDLIKEINDNNVFKLIETLADRVAIEILKAFPLVKEVSVTVKKPDAPIPYDFNYVSVTSKRSWHKAYIAIGSNIGESKKIVAEAVEELKARPEIKELTCSEIIVTKPYGVTDQPDFLNGCMKAETYLTPYELLDLLHEIENKHGRKRELRWGPRTLDLDIILFDELVLDDEDLNIPHIDMQNRTFVLEPLCEIDKNAFHPIFGKTAEELLKALKGRQE